MDLNRKPPSTRHGEGSVTENVMRDGGGRWSEDVTEESHKGAPLQATRDSNADVPPSQRQDGEGTRTEQQIITASDSNDGNGQTKDQELSAKGASISAAAAGNQATSSGTGTDSEVSSGVDNANQLEKTPSQADKMPTTTMVMILAALCVCLVSQKLQSFITDQSSHGISNVVIIRANLAFNNRWLPSFQLLTWSV